MPPHRSPSRPSLCSQQQTPTPPQYQSRPVLDSCLLDHEESDELSSCFSASSSLVSLIIHHQQRFHLLKSILHCSGHLFTTKANSRNVIRECREAPEWNPRCRSPGPSLLFAKWHGPECGGSSLSISRAQSKTVNDLEAKVAPRRRISVARPFAFHPAVSLTLALSLGVSPSILHRVRHPPPIPSRNTPSRLTYLPLRPAEIHVPPRKLHLLPLHLRLPSLSSRHHRRHPPIALPIILLSHLSLLCLHHALRCQPLHSRQPLLSHLQLQRPNFHARPGTPNG